MSFKFIIQIFFFCFLFVSAGISLIGCSEYLKGAKKNEEAIELSDAKFAHLKEIPTNIRKFMTSEISLDELNQSFDSLKEALVYFSERTVGSSPGGYTIEDMRSFFGRYFLKENNISPETAQELMKLKKALLGGSDEILTKVEIAHVVDILGILKSELGRLNPYAQVILLNKSSLNRDQIRMTWVEIKSSMKHLSLSLKKLLQSTELAKSDYSFEDAKTLISGLSDFVSGSQPFSTFSTASEFVPLLESIKDVLIGKNARLSGLGDWNLALDNIVDLYGAFLRYHYIVGNQGMESPLEIHELTQFGGQLFQLLNGSYQMTKTGQIPFENIDVLITQFTKKFTIPLGITADTLQKTYKVFIVNVLESSRGGESRGLFALNRAHMASFARELNVWRLGQSFVNHLPFDSQGFLLRKDLLTTYDKFDYVQAIRQGIGKSSLEQQALEASWKDFGILLKVDRPINFTSEGRYIVSADQGQLPMTWKALTKFNFTRSLARILMLGYSNANSLTMAKGNIFSDSLVRWYDDFRAIGLELKAFDPRSANSGKRSFQEANFFTFSGNGDEQMDFKETFEFVAVLFSAGLNSTNNLRAGLISAQAENQQIDVFGFKMFNENSVKDELYKNFASYFNNLPGLAQYVAKMKAGQWESFYSVVMSASRLSKADGGVVEMADLRTFVVVLHYIETIFTIYDRDGNGLLAIDEIEGAAPRFLNFLRKANPGINDASLTDGFSFLIVYGTRPTRWDVIKFTAGKHFTLPEVSRNNIAQVLKVLKEDLNKPVK